jgi:hypothetical protein
MSEPCLCGAPDCDYCHPGGREDIEREEAIDDLMATDKALNPANIWTFGQVMGELSESWDSRTPDPVAQAFDEARKGNHRLAWTLLVGLVTDRCRENAADKLDEIEMAIELELAGV